MNLQATLRRNGTCCFLVTLSCCEPVKCDSLHDANDLLVRLSVYVFGEATVDMFDEAEMT